MSATFDVSLAAYACASSANAASAGLQRRVGSIIGSLSDRIQALTRRFGASQFDVQHAVGILGRAYVEVGRETAFLSRQQSMNAEKACEASAEEVRVRAAQLFAYAQGLEWEAEAEEAEEGTSVMTAASALLSCPDWQFTGFIGVELAAPAVLRLLDEALRIRDGVHPARCIVSGGGVAYYQVGDNHVFVSVLDSEGAVVESIETGDVCVSVNGGSMASVVVREAGAVEVVYRVSEESVAPLSLSISVCGAVLPRSPWTVTCPLRDSAILGGVATERLTAFLGELAGWLPGRAYTLLYRGSRDGMTAAAFHKLCDRKGPTLVLLRCSQGWVFGGYACVSWESSICDMGSFHDAAFLFSVTGPYTTAPWRTCVSKHYAPNALYCHPSHGLYVVSSRYFESDFDDGSCCHIDGGGAYEDVIGHGRKSLTGDEYFLPAELEVYAVNARDTNVMQQL